VDVQGDISMSKWKIKLYRTDSVTTVEYDNVKHAFWMGAQQSILVIARWADDGSHYYIHWPREQIAWFTCERDGQYGQT
jgi:hypothetical protein